MSQSQGSRQVAAQQSGRRRRPVMSGRKAEQTLDQTGEDVDHEKQKRHLEELLEACKKDPLLLRDCRAVVRSREGAEKSKQALRRGVRTLGDVPAYVVREALARLSEEDLATFRNQADDDNQTFCVWALGGDPRFRLPQIGMDLDEFSAWAREYNSTLPVRLPSFDWDATHCDLDWRLGAVSFFVPEADVATLPRSQLVRHVKNNSTGHHRELPEGFRMLVREIGSTWCLQNNYSLQDVVLTNVVDRRQMFLASLFAPVAEAVSHVNLPAHERYMLIVVCTSIVPQRLNVIAYQCDESNSQLDAASVVSVICCI